MVVALVALALGALGGVEPGPESEVVTLEGHFRVVDLSGDRLGQVLGGSPGFLRGDVLFVFDTDGPALLEIEASNDAWIGRRREDGTLAFTGGQILYVVEDGLLRIDTLGRVMLGRVEAPPPVWTTPVEDCLVILFDRQRLASVGTDLSTIAERLRSDLRTNERWKRIADEDASWIEALLLDVDDRSGLRLGDLGFATRSRHAPTGGGGDGPLSLTTPDGFPVYVARSGD